MAKLQFNHVNVFDGVTERLHKDCFVRVEDGKISRYGAFTQECLQFEGEQIEAEGMTLMPGLIDAHANIVGLITKEQPMGVAPRTVASSVLRGVKEGENCIRAGVTTIRVDTAGHHGTYALGEAFEARAFVGPHMIVPGRAICTTCGHGWNFGNHVADGPWEVRKAVREEIMHGAQWIKLMATGGAGTATERIDDKQMSQAELEAGIEEAHNRGRKVFAHLSVTEAIYECVAAGIDSVEHGIFLDAPCAEFVAKHGSYLTPTLGVYRRLVEQGEKGLVPVYMYEKSKQIVKRHTEAFRHALAAGVKIVSGTDSGQDWFPLGASLLRELEIMNEEGMSNVQCLIAATSRNAHMLERPEIGIIAEGKNADVLVVQGDPLARMSDIRNTRYVLKDGQLLHRADA